MYNEFEVFFFFFFVLMNKNFKKFHGTNAFYMLLSKWPTNFEHIVENVLNLFFFGVHVGVLSRFTLFVHPNHTKSPLQ